MHIRTIFRILLFTILMIASMAFACNNSGGGGSGGDSKSNECDTAKGANRPSYCKEAVHIPFDGEHNVNDYILATPMGITVRSVVPVPQEGLLAIDQAWVAVLAHTRAIYPNWPNYSNPTDNQVVLIDPDHYSVESDPGAGLLNVYYTALGDDPHKPNRQFVSSADTCYGCPGFFYPDITKNAIYLMAVVPHQAGVDPAHPDQTPWSHLRFFRESIYNSWEHVEECGNTVQVCLQFATTGDQHPHWGDDIWNDPLPVITKSLKRAQPKRLTSTCRLIEECKPISGAQPTTIEAPEDANRPMPNKAVK